jgi:hypothetical protein
MPEKLRQNLMLPHVFVPPGSQSATSLKPHIVWQLVSTDDVPTW